MLLPDQVRWLQIEATTRCNAWCPGCGRSKGGYKLIDDFVVEDLSIGRFQEVLEQFPNVTTIDFCGTYGDAIAAQNVIELTKIALAHADKIIVRTNGSLRNVAWWEEYAQILSNHKHEVWFCLDGLADTHSIYRQATNFDTIIRNAQAFMSRGGCAVWQFIPWAHNEHQIKDCLKLSQQLGFTRFELVKNVRKNFEAKNYQSGNVYEIQPWSRDKISNKYEQVRTHVEESRCQHLSQSSYYLNANGQLSPCCFMNTRLCSMSIEGLPDIKTEIGQNPRSVCLHHCGS